MTHELRLVERPADWESWHAIRECVLWEARGQFGVYDRNHPSLGSPNHLPFILTFEGQPIGAIAVEVDGVDAWLRRVAISEPHQRRGHGRVMLHLAMDQARLRGCTRALSNVAADAVGFYEKLHFVITEEHPGHGPQMSRHL